MRQRFTTAALIAIGTLSLPPLTTAAAAPMMRDIYQELVEIDTTDSVGDTLRAAESMAARLRAAGLPAADVQVFRTAEKRGNLVARLRGTGRQKPLLLLAHLDVVEAKPGDWSTEPFKLIEKDGWYYGRGTQDDKYMAAAFVHNLARYQREGFRPDRDLILALTTDEEISDRHGLGITWLLKHQRALIDAEFALNEGGSVGVKNGKPLFNSVQTSEKLYQSFWLEANNKGGHSSQPRPDNAIYALSAALGRLANHKFPLQLNATTKAFFERSAALESGQTAADMRAVASGTGDASAIARLAANPSYNAQMRTTCVATRLEGGHADNALPQTARAMVNCRILPGMGVAATQSALNAVIADANVKLTATELDTPSEPSPLSAQVMQPIETLTRKFWPGITVLPTMSAGATDGRYLRNAGIPTYGHSGLASDMLDNRAHGRDERVSVNALEHGTEYLYQLVKLLAGGK